MVLQFFCSRADRYVVWNKNRPWPFAIQHISNAFGPVCNRLCKTAVVFYFFVQIFKKLFGKQKVDYREILQGGRRIVQHRFVDDSSCRRNSRGEKLMKMNPPSSGIERIQGHVLHGSYSTTTPTGRESRSVKTGSTAQSPLVPSCPRACRESAASGFVKHGVIDRDNKRTTYCVSVCCPQFYLR